MKENIGKILKSILELTNKTAQDDLLDVVKEFIADYADEVEPFATELAKSISHQFISMASNSNEADEDYDNKCLTAVGMLTTLETLLDILEDKENLIDAAEEVVTEVIAWILQNRKGDYYEEALSLLSSITTYRVSDPVWPALELLKNILEAGDEGGVEYFVDMMPALHNFVTVESKQFFSSNDNLQIVFGMVKYTLDSVDSGEEAETHALKLLEVLVFQGGKQTPGVIGNALAIAYNRRYDDSQREIQTSELRTMITTVILACLYEDNTQDTVNYLSERNWLNEGLKEWLSDFDSIFGIHDRRLTLLIMAKFFQSANKPSVISQSVNQILPACIKLFKALKNAYEFRANNDSDDEDDGNYDSDEDGEFGMGGENDGDHEHNNSQPNIDRGNIEQLNDDESDDEGKDYMKMLKNFELKDWADEGETQYEDYTTVIDEDGIPFEGQTKDKEGVVEQHDIPDEYIEFNKAMEECSNVDRGFFDALMGAMSAEDQKDFAEIQEEAKNRFNDRKSKALEKQGGYKFETDASRIDMNFTNQN